MLDQRPIAVAMSGGVDSSTVAGMLIREGHRVRVFLTEDLLVPAYAQHKMPSDL